MHNTASLFSTIDAAKYIEISLPALKYHIKEGNIKPVLVGNSLVFTKVQLDEFIKIRRAPGRPRKEQ